MTHEHTPHASSEHDSAHQPVKKSRRSENIFLFGFGMVLLVACIVLFATVRIQAARGSAHPAVVFGAQVFGINPQIASVNGHTISYRTYVDDIQTLRLFYANQGRDGELANLTDEQISDLVVSRLLVNTLLIDLAETFSVSVSDLDLLAERQNIIAQFSDEKIAEEQIQQTFGSSLDEYMVRVVQPVLLEGAVRKAFLADTSVDASASMDKEIKARHILFMVNDETERAAVQEKAQGVLDEILAGANFEAMAKQHGSDGTKDVGGDLGWFGRGVMVPAFEEAVFALSVGKTGSSLVETDFGYHIVRVDDTREVKSFDAFMTAQMKKASIIINPHVHNPFADLPSQG